MSDALLTDYRGYLHTNGYDGYGPVCTKNDLRQVCCFAHAKAHVLESYRYLRHICKELPKAKSLENIEQLLPWHVDKELINQGWAKKIDGF